MSASESRACSSDVDEALRHGDADDEDLEVPASASTNSSRLPAGIAMLEILVLAIVPAEEEVDRPTGGDIPRSPARAPGACRLLGPPGVPLRTSGSKPGRAYSHSIVAGGFDVRSSATRFTAGISLMIRLEIVSSRS